MQYLTSLTLPIQAQEEGFLLSFPPQAEEACYNNENPYPFKLFPRKKLSSLSFSPITMFYGGNGSGKSTLLNIIAEKLTLERSSPFNSTPLFGEYLKMCECELSCGRHAPRGSKIITSDDVFDYMLDLRALNEGTDRRRDELFEEYNSVKYEKFHLRTMDDFEKLRKANEVRRSTRSAYTASRIRKNVPAKSNGESAFAYFTDKIRDYALYLLDEPENSLAAPLQKELAGFITDSVRFYGCQFVISTHSPFLLAMKDAVVYDLDLSPSRVRRWTELENVKIYRDFFEEHRGDFE